MHDATRLPARRTVLAGALAGLAVPALSACTGGGPFAPQPAPTVPPDVVAADRAGERERRLLAAYDAALALAPQLADRLTPLRADHEAHLDALGLADPPAPDPAPTAGAGTDPSAAPSPSPSPVVAAPPLPQDPEALLAALAELERRAANDHSRAAVLGGRGVGAVLASLAASEAAHVVALQ